MVLSKQSKAKSFMVAAFASVALVSCGKTKTGPDLEALTASAPQGQLPGTARPLSYDLDMRIDPREENFSGSVAINIELDQASEGLWLHGDDLSVTEVTVTPASGETGEASYTEVLPSGVSWIGFGRELEAGEITLNLVYEGAFDANLAGLFRVEEQGDAYALAKSESIQARRYLPGFDEPGYKAPFTISLTIPEGDIAISNTPEVSREATEPGFETVQFATTRPLPTFLLSLAVGPFDVVTMPDLAPNAVRDWPVPLRGIARRGRGDDLAYALQVTPELVEIFETELGLPYPYKKLDIVAAPQWPSGATELAAAITYRESRILLPEGSAPAARRSLLGIHSHEMAHMWFGDLVTPPWWDDLWLKEAFATWGTPITLSQLEPEGGYEIDAVRRAISAMRLDSLANTRAVREPITRNEDIRNAYDSITYSKGMAIIAMADAYFGAENFRPALGRYIKAYEDGVAASPQFFEVIGEVSGEPQLTEAFRSFIEQKGVPLLGAELTCEAGAAPAVTLSQTRYKPLGSTIEDETRWTIPVCIAYAGETGRERSCTMLREPAAQLSLDAEMCPDWIMPNAGGTGYYRWDMPGNDWQALAAHFDALTPAEGLSAVDSSVAAFEAGNADAASLLGVFEAAAIASDRRVAMAAAGHLTRYAGLMEGEALTALRSFAHNLYAGRYAALEGASSEDELLLHNQLTAFLAETAKDESIRADLASRLVDYLDGDEDALSSDLHGAAMRVDIDDRGVPAFDRILAARETLDDPRFAASAAAALGETDDPDLIARVQALALSGELGSRETYVLIRTQINRDAAGDQTWEWLKANYPAFIANIPRQWPRRTPGLAAAFCDTSRIAELDALFETHGDLAPGHERSLAQTRERITLCAALKAAPLIELGEALEGQE